MGEMTRDEWISTQLALIAKGGRVGLGATSALYRGLDKQILGYLVKEGVPYASAEEILQTAFLKIFERAGQWHGGGSASAWLWAIVRNARTDYFRGGQKEIFPNDEEWELIGNKGHEVAEEASSIPLQECVGRAIQRFAKANPERAEALRLLHLEEWSIAQVAQFLGRTQAATKEFLSQCRKHFKPFLQPCLEYLEP